MFPSQHADLGRGAIPETVLNSRENVGSGEMTWVLGCGCIRTSNIDTMAAAMGYGPNVDHLPIMQAEWTRNAEAEAREILRIAYRQAHGGAEPPPMDAPAKHDRKANERPGSTNLKNHNYIPVGQKTTNNDNTMFQFGNKEKTKKVPGFSGVGDNASLSFSISEDATATTREETLEEYAARYGDIPLTTTASLGNAGILEEAASAKYEGIRRSQDDENREPQWAIPDSQHDDVIPDTIFTSGTAQNPAIFTTAAIHDNTTGNMPPKITFKLKSETTKAREAPEADEKAEKAMKNKFPTAEKIRRDMLDSMADRPDRPTTPNGGDDYLKNLHSEPLIAEKYCMFGDSIEAMRLDLNAPCYDEAHYENPGTPETPGKWVEEEWENRARFGNLQPTNFYTAPPGAPMEWKTKIGVDASGWDIYSEDLLAMNVQNAKFNALGARFALAPKEKTKIGVNSEGWNIYADVEDALAKQAKAKDAEAATPCGIDGTKICNHALCKSKTVAQTPLWSPFPAHPGFSANSFETRDTAVPGWFSRLADVPEGTEIAFDTSAPGFQEADRAAKVTNMTMAEAEKIVKEAADKFAKEMADAKADAALGDMKTSKKRILALEGERA